jgi:hypothetical protein
LDTSTNLSTSLSTPSKAILKRCGKL